MKKQSDYRLIQGKGSAFGKLVNDFLKTGYVLVGGTFIDGENLAQAVVKETEVDETAKEPTPVAKAEKK